MAEYCSSAALHNNYLKQAARYKLPSALADGGNLNQTEPALAKLCGSSRFAEQISAR